MHSINVFVEIGRKRGTAVISIACLHLLPGVIVFAVYIPTALVVSTLGIPSLLAAPLSVLAGSIPFQLGYLLYRGLKRNGKWSLKGVVLFREQIRLRAYVVYGLLAIGWMALVVLFVGRPIRALLVESVFSWVPERFLLELPVADAAEYSRQTILVVTGINWLVIGLVAPAVEELYFRGFLLPRLTAFGAGAPVVNAGLFALYHFVTPWDVPLVFLAYLLPVYFVWRTKNVYLGVAVHSLTNFAAGFSTFVAGLQMMNAT